MAGLASLNHIPTIAAFLAATLFLTLLYASLATPSNEFDFEVSAQGDDYERQIDEDGSTNTPTPLPSPTAEGGIDPEWDCETDPSHKDCPPPPPTIWSLYRDNSTRVVANYTRSDWDGSSSHYYSFKLERKTSSSGSYRPYKSLFETVPPARFTNAPQRTSGYAYRFRVRAQRCRYSSLTSCGDWTSWKYFTDTIATPTPTPTPKPPTNTPTPVPPTNTPTPVPPTNTPTPTPSPRPPSGLDLERSNDTLLRLDYTRSHWPMSNYHYYVFELQRKSTITATFSDYRTSNDGYPPVFSTTFRGKILKTGSRIVSGLGESVARRTCAPTAANGRLGITGRTRHSLLLRRRRTRLLPQTLRYRRILRRQRTRLLLQTLRRRHPLPVVR